MSTHSQINHLSKLENGDITAISDDAVDDIWTQSHSIGVPHGLKIVRTCTKEDFSCGDEFYYVEVKDVDTFTTFANYMDYTEDAIAEENKADVVSFMIGDAPETEATGREARAQRRAYRTLKWEILNAIEDAFYDGSWESYNLFV
tara:strand:+ start:5083 stop:5517 length:435 start_codon:yes stop_codon:yes gene_type:complete